VVGVVNAAFASRELSTARRFMGDELASIVPQANSRRKEERDWIEKATGKMNQKRGKMEDESRAQRYICVEE
jgi:hypothetical protein